MYSLKLIFTHISQCHKNLYIYIPIDIHLRCTLFPDPTVSVISLRTGKCLIKYHSFLYTIRNVRNLYGCPY